MTTTEKLARDIRRFDPQIMNEQETWEAALVKCGYWHHHNDCPDSHRDEWRFCKATHEMPALGDAAAVVAMLEWGKQHEMGVSYDKLIGEWMATCAKNGEHLGEMSPSWIECYHKSLPLALAAAVNEVQP